MLLSQIKRGKVKIVGFLGGRNFQRKMFALGIFIGDIVEVIVNNYPGPVIIAKNGLRVGIGFGMANKILIEKL